MRKVLFLGGGELGIDVRNFLADLPDVEVYIDPAYNEEDLASDKFDLLVSVNFDKLVREPLLSSTRLGCVNIHHSYNLRIRGRHCATHAILAAREDEYRFHGTTLHYMNAKLDAGDIIDTRPVYITEQDTAFTLFHKCDFTALQMAKDYLPRLLAGETFPTRPPEPRYRTFRAADLPSKNIDLWQDPVKVYDLVRALTFPPYEGPYAILDGKRYELSTTADVGTPWIIDAGYGRFVFVKD